MGILKKAYNGIKNFLLVKIPIETDWVLGGPWRSRDGIRRGEALYYINKVNPPHLNEEREANKKLVKNFRDLGDLIYALRHLDDEGILNQRNYTVILTYIQNIGSLSPVAALSALSNNGMLNQRNFDFITSQPPLYIDSIITSHLNDAGILNQRNFSAIMNSHLDHGLFESILRTLSIAGILNQSNFNTVVTSILNKSNSDTVENRSEIYQFSVALATIWNENERLNPVHILNQETFDIIKIKLRPAGVANVLYRLHLSRLLTRDNIETIKDHADPSRLQNALQLLGQAQILNQANFNILIRSNYLYTQSANTIIWDSLPSHLLTQEVFNHLVTIDRQNLTLEQRDAAMRQCVRQVFELAAKAQAEQKAHPAFNNTQSTHTASVHKSSSESATKLFNRYGSKIEDTKLDDTVETIVKYISSLPNPTNSIKIDAAKRCIMRITNPGFTFTDPTSRINIKQLLALV